MKKLNGKKYKDYTATDLRNFWCAEYQKKFGQDYQPHGYGGNELKALKELLEVNDVYDILTGMKRSFRSRDKQSIANFVEDFESYLPRFGKIEFFVGEQGKQLEKQKLLELIMLDSKWLPDVEDDQQKRKLIEWFEEWIERKNGKL